MDPPWSYKIDIAIHLQKMIGQNMGGGSQSTVVY